MGRSVDVESLVAERDSLHALLADIPPMDFVGRVGLEAKLKKVESQLAEISDFPERAAETFLYLGGESVDGSRGIDINLASDILKNYQTLVSVVHAAHRNQTSLSESGPIPSSEASRLQLVGTPRGSFGFALKEKMDQTRLTDTPLHESVETVNELIAASAVDSSADFEAVIADEQPRVVKELGNFLKSLNSYEASLRLVSERTKIDLPKDKIAIASDRTENITITETDVRENGIFLGARKHSRDFNFQPDGKDTISGKLGDEIVDDTVSMMNMEFQDKRCVAILVKKVTKREESQRASTRWTLKDIHLEG